MSYHKLRTAQSGFTLAELAIVMSLIGIVALGIYTFTISSSTNYLKLHSEGIRFSELSEKSQRVTKVIRGAGDITEAEHNSVTMYAYFSPADQYYSIVRYYLNVNKTQLLADVTPLTSNPPIGTPITSKKQTFVVMDDFYDDPALNTFEYLDSAGTAYSLPIGDLHTIKGMRVNLSTANNNSPNDTKTAMSIQVSLRNRKTNL